MFHNVDEYALLYPRDVMRPARYCAPARCGALRGHLDVAGAQLITGWAQHSDFPETQVCLDIYADRRLVGQTLVNLYREDLKAAGLGSGHHAFAFVPPEDSALRFDRIEVRRSTDGAPLATSKARRRSQTLIGRTAQCPRVPVGGERCFLVSRRTGFRLSWV